MKSWAGWLTSWNQDCWEKYQPPQIRRWYHFSCRKCRGKKEPLDEGGREKLKLNIQKTKTMASGPITWWQIDGEKSKNCQISLSWAPKSLWMVTAATKLKRRLLLERKAVINIDSILKSRDITLLTKFHLVKAMVFPVVMCGCEKWTIKKAEHGRIDAFELCNWRRLLRAPWTTRSNQSILKEINPEYSLEGLMLKLNTLATGCTEPTDWKSLWCWERLSARGEGGNIKWDGWIVWLTQWTWVWAKSGRWWRIGKPRVLQSMGSQSQTQLSEWTATIILVF